MLSPTMCLHYKKLDPAVAVSFDLCVCLEILFMESILATLLSIGASRLLDSTYALKL